ncbi:hypothetical protein [Pseudonocardia sp. TRM90224]|uniref:hypothetical protein n=1 Tax=Pseudonocardia sp. TRM90224 TaxID=2812678 RepID=UPI001E28D8F2|nr:hypothetical protein [Pseudonocardia sp. TRM90224]
MIDWSGLRHAYGTAQDVPALLQRLEPDPEAEVWEELWSRLCHQGDVYSASFASLPALTSAIAGWPPADRILGLNLAAAIVAGADRDGSDARQRYAAEIANLAYLTAESRRAADPADPAAYIYLLQATLAFDGVPVWGLELDKLADGEYEAPCPTCGTENYIVIGEDGRFTTVEEYVTDPAAVRIPLRPAVLDGLAERLWNTARGDGQQDVADRLRHLFGHGTCGQCAAQFAVAEAIATAAAG